MQSSKQGHKPTCAFCRAHMHTGGIVEANGGGPPVAICGKCAASGVLGDLLGSCVSDSGLDVSVVSATFFDAFRAAAGKSEVATK